MRRPKKAAPPEVDPEELLLRETAEDIEEGGGVEIRSGPKGPPERSPAPAAAPVAEPDSINVSILAPRLALLIDQAVEEAESIQRRSFVNPKLQKVTERLIEAQMWARRPF